MPNAFIKTIKDKDENTIYPQTVASAVLGLYSGSQENIQTILDYKANRTELDNYLPLAGGTLSGNLRIVKSTPELVMRPMEGSDNYLDMFYASGDWLELQNRSSNGDYNELIISKATGVNANQYIRLGRKVDGTTTYYSLYGEHNAQNFLPGIYVGETFPTTAIGAGQIKYYYNINNGIAGNIPSNNNANGVLRVSKHNGDYASELGFSSNGNLYYRSFNGSAITTSAPWEQILIMKSLQGITTDFNTIKDGLYHTYTDGNTTSYITNAPGTGGSVLFSWTPYTDNNTDIRTVQLSLNPYGRAFIRGFREANKPWKEIVTNTGTWGISITGNAATASKLTNITSTDNASSTTTERYVFFSYDDKVTGRPAYSSNFTYRTNNNTLTVGTVKLRNITFAGSCTNTAGSAYNWSFSPIQIRDGKVSSNDGVCCLLGYGGGLTIVGSGESASTAYTALVTNGSNNDNSEQLYLCSDNEIRFAAGMQSNNTSAAVTVRIDGSNKLYGAVWNDYAEYREADTVEPGRCVIEVGNDTLTLSTARLQRGAEIISDTFGFAIGETDRCKTPIAATGRVLAYTYEDREEYRKHIGCPVCSGPNGTVSIMTDEEEKEYPSRIIGFVSSIPDYEEWGEGTTVKVNNRVWIRIK